jgi:hypothetical protein
VATVDERAEIADLARNLGVRGNGQEYIRAKCPVCLSRTGKPDFKGSLSLQCRTGFFRCWKCSVRGRLDGYDDVEIEPWETDEPSARPKIEKPEGYASLDASRMARPYAAYMRERGVPDVMWAPLEIGYVSARHRNKWQRRVIVPMLGSEGEWLGFLGRLIEAGSDFPKYLYPQSMVRREILFNAAALSAPTSEPVILVEGVFDALRVWPDGVATLGKPSGDHVRIVRGSTRPVCVCLDGDAWEEGEALSWRLRMDGLQCGAVRLPPGLDPGTADAARLRHASVEAVATASTVSY